MSSLMRNLTSPHMLGVFGALCCLGWTIAYITYYAKVDGLIDEHNNVVGKDFMAFYIGGTIIRQGQGAALYQASLQQQVQTEILRPEKLDGFSYYINPAAVAVVYSILTLLPYAAAAHTHALLMLLAYILGIWVLKPYLGGIGKHWVVAAMIGFVWFPISHTITGGQNAAFCFLLLATAYVAARRGNQWLAGLALGLLLFKPQYALPLLGLLFLRKQLITVCTAAVVGAGQYLLGAMYCGWNWPANMVRALHEVYRPQERQVSGATHISLMEVLDHSVIKRLEQAGDQQNLINMVTATGYLLIAAIILYLIWTWRKAQPRSPEFALYYALCTAANLVISLHTQYYDVALLLLPVLLILSEQLRCGHDIGNMTRVTLAALFMLSFPVYLTSQQPWVLFQPLCLLPVGVAVWAQLMIRRRTQATAG